MQAVGFREGRDGGLQAACGELVPLPPVYTPSEAVAVLIAAIESPSREKRIGRRFIDARGCDLSLSERLEPHDIGPTVKATGTAATAGKVIPDACVTRPAITRRSGLIGLQARRYAFSPRPCLGIMFGSLLLKGGDASFQFHCAAERSEFGCHHGGLAEPGENHQKRPYTSHTKPLLKVGQSPRPL